MSYTMLSCSALVTVIQSLPRDGPSWGRTPPYPHSASQTSVQLPGWVHEWGFLHWPWIHSKILQKRETGFCTWYSHSHDGLWDLLLKTHPVLVEVSGKMDGKVLVWQEYHMLEEWRRQSCHQPWWNMLMFPLNVGNSCWRKRGGKSRGGFPGWTDSG